MGCLGQGGSGTPTPRAPGSKAGASRPGFCTRPPHPQQVKRNRNPGSPPPHPWGGGGRVGGGNLFEKGGQERTSAVAAGWEALCISGGGVIDFKRKPVSVPWTSASNAHPSPSSLHCFLPRSLTLVPAIFFESGRHDRSLHY